MRAGNDLLEGFQVGSQIGARIVDNARQQEALDYRKKRDEIEDTFKREQLAQSGEDRDLRRKEATLRLDALAESIEDARKLRQRNEIAQSLTAQGQEDALRDKVQSLNLPAPTIPMKAAAPQTTNDPTLGLLQKLDAAHSQLQGQFATAQANGDVEGMQAIGQKITDFRTFSQGMANALIQREAKKKNPIRVKHIDSQGNEIEGNFETPGEVRSFLNEFPSNQEQAPAPAQTPIVTIKGKSDYDALPIGGKYMFNDQLYTKKNNALGTTSQR